MPRNTKIILMLGILIVTSAIIWLPPQMPDEAGMAGASVETGHANIGGAFSLTDQTGKPVTDKDLHGTLSLVFFGFSHCPDICPVTLDTFTQVMQGLGEESNQLTPVFITVDPARDTPEVMAETLSPFHPAIIGLTGSEAEVKQATSAYKAYAAKRAGQEGQDNYLMDHSGYFYLMDRQGEYIRHFSQENTPAEIIAAIQPHLK